jgi:hypothetical protein
MEKRIKKNPRKTKFFGGLIFSLPSTIYPLPLNQRSQEERRDQRYTKENEHKVL